MGRKSRQSLFLAMGLLISTPGPANEIDSDLVSSPLDEVLGQRPGTRSHPWSGSSSATSVKSWQQGEDNWLSIAVVGEGNAIKALQLADSSQNNQLDAWVEGYENRVFLLQAGNNNGLTADIQGNYNQLGVTMLGDNNQVTVNQYGDNNKANISIMNSSKEIAINQSGSEFYLNHF